MPIEIILGAVALAVGVVGVLFFVFLAVPVGAPTVHELPPERPRGPNAAASTPGARSARLVRRVPSGYIGWIERQIVYAGRQSDWTAGGFLVIKLVVSAGAVVLAGLWIAVDPQQPLRVVPALVMLALALVAPEVILNSRADDRQTAIRLALPDTLDQMTIAVEAGLGFDAAMAKAAHNGSGPLAEELIRVIQDMSIGQSRRDAYRALERRTSSEDLRRFIRAVVQADAYGIAIADVLRVQAGEMRVKRRQRAEELAMKVPVKIVFPLVLCILPVLFIVILTPAVIGIFSAFSGL
ncbi:type II secretion system F family protein [uncultured Schumannella sp.]|jgi:tight adherence protein C|uniref:type II secretion system F family protein n=1 Tax=uncultured Schumannella sp. TaxID=1195956 RepID=UPI0025EB74C4|nr:type II secretion system F family protein [uncultured Schumannella sp.]